MRIQISSCERTRCVHSDFSRSRPATTTIAKDVAPSAYIVTGRSSKHSHRPELSKLPRTVDPLSIRIRPVSPGRRVILRRQLPRSWQPFNLSASASPVKARRWRSFRVLRPPAFLQRLQSTRFRRSGQGAIFRISLHPAQHRPFNRQPERISASSAAVNPLTRSPRDPIFAVSAKGRIVYQR